MPAPLTGHQTHVRPKGVIYARNLAATMRDHGGSDLFLPGRCFAFSVVKVSEIPSIVGCMVGLRHGRGHKQVWILKGDLVGEEFVLHMPLECELLTVFLEKFLASCSRFDEVQVASLQVHLQHSNPEHVNILNKELEQSSQTSSPEHFGFS